MQTSNLYSSPFNPNPNDPSIHPCTRPALFDIPNPHPLVHSKSFLIFPIPTLILSLLFVFLLLLRVMGEFIFVGQTPEHESFVYDHPPTTKYGSGSSVNNLSKSAVNTRTYDTLATYDIYEDHRLLESRASQSGGLWRNGHINGSRGREIEL